jgi:hypothetical protein
MVESEESFRSSTFGLGWHPFDGIVFLKAIKADEGCGGVTGPSDGISNVKSWQISIEEGYDGLTVPSDGLSNKKH